MEIETNRNPGFPKLNNFNQLNVFHKSWLFKAVIYTHEGDVAILKIRLLSFANGYQTWNQAEVNCPGYSAHERRNLKYAAHHLIQD